MFAKKQTQISLKLAELQGFLEIREFRTNFPKISKSWPIFDIGSERLQLYYWFRLTALHVYNKLKAWN